MNNILQIFGFLSLLLFLLNNSYYCFGAPIITLEKRIEKARSQVRGIGLKGEPWIPSSVDFFNHNEEFEMQPNDNFWVAWTPNDQLNIISFTLAVNTIGWIGWGPSETGGMIGGNPCVVREIPVGSGNFQAIAMHSDTFEEPDVNSDQNCQLTSFTRNGNETLLSFTRPLRGCRPEDLDIHPDTTVRFIGAWGTNQDFVYHGSFRFTTELWAFTGPIIPPPLPDDVQVYNATLNPMMLPATRDLYFCRGHSLPQDRRYHILQQDVIMYDIAPATYHHYIFFECPNGLPREWQDPNYQSDCAVIPSPSCLVFYFGWASGQAPIYFEQGLPIGQGEGAAKWGLFQSHIDNPYSSSNIYEPGWGGIIWYSPTLTPIESGTFGLYGGVPLGGMPGGIAEFHTRSECAALLSANAFPNGIYLNAVAPHMHGLGIAAKLELLREDGNGGWYEPYAMWEQHSWDNNWQGDRIFASPGKRFEAGDRLRCHCKYNTSNKTTETRNGEGFEDEMCICYIRYYPRSDISICAEFPPTVPSHPEYSGIGVSFADVSPFLFPVGPEEYEPLPEPPNNCNAK